MARSKAIVVHQNHEQQSHRENVRSIRIRRAILAGKRGPTTPVPSWKLYENPMSFASKQDHGTSSTSIIATNGRQITISARKLAATLWELQELPICRVPASSSKDSASCKVKQRFNHRESVGSPKLMLPPPSPSTPVPQNPTLKVASSAKSSDSNRRSPFSDSVYHSRRTSDTSETSRQSYEESSSHETPAKFGETLTTCSKDLLKMLNNVRSTESSISTGNNTQHQHNATVALLQTELEQTRQRMKQLEHANKAARQELSDLLEWREQEQEQMKAALMAMQRQVEDEKRKKHKLEAANKKLATQAQEAKLGLATAENDLERERRARQLMEDVCDELAREIGRDKAEVEELKMATYKAREEVEEERRMLQMAEVWREERVQMKLAEARHELQEKNVALDRLKAEMEEFLAAKSVNGRKPTAVVHRSALAAAGQRGGGGSSGEDDLHSIDLNKESLYDRTQGNRWTSYGKRHQKQQQQQQPQVVVPAEADEDIDDDQLLQVFPRRRRMRSRSNIDRTRKSSRYYDLKQHHQQQEKMIQKKLDSSSSSSSSSSDTGCESNVMSGGIETIPEHCELYNNVADEGFFGSRKNASSVTRRWSPEALPTATSRDNSLRAKLLEEDALPLRIK